MTLKSLFSTLVFLTFVSCKGGGGGSNTESGTVKMISTSDSTAFVSYSYTPFLNNFGTSSGISATTGNELSVTGSGSTISNSGSLSSSGSGLQSATDERKAAIDLDEDRVLNIDVNPPANYNSCTILGNDFSNVVCNILGFSFNIGTLLNSAGHSLSLQISALKNGSDKKQSNSISLSHYQFEPVVNLNPSDSGSDDSVFNLIVYNDHLYFSGSESSSEKHLYRWDGNTVERFSDMAQSGNDFIGDLTLYDSKLFFRGQIDNDDRSLLFTDGTSIERVVNTSTVPTQNDLVRTLIASGESLYFHASTDGSVNTGDLYRYNANSVVKVSSGLGNIPFEYIQEFDGKTYMSNINSNVFHEWDGSTIRGALDSRAGGQDLPKEQLILGDELVVRGILTSSFDYKLFKYNGNTFELVTNINGAGNSEVIALLNEVVEDKIFYISVSGGNRSLMSYDGTEIVEHYRSTDRLNVLKHSEGHIFFTQEVSSGGNSYEDLYSLSLDDNRIQKWIEGEKVLTNSEFSNLNNIVSVFYADPTFYGEDLFFGLSVSTFAETYSKGLHRLRKLPKN